MEPSVKSDWGQYLAAFNTSDFKHQSVGEKDAPLDRKQVHNILLKLVNLSRNVSDLLPVLNTSESARRNLKEILAKSESEVKALDSDTKEQYGARINNLCSRILDGVQKEVSVQQDWVAFLKEFKVMNFGHRTIAGIIVAPDRVQVKGISEKLEDLSKNASDLLRTLSSSPEARQYLQEIVTNSVDIIQNARPDIQEDYEERIKQACQEIKEKIKSVMDVNLAPTPIKTKTKTQPVDIKTTKDVKPADQSLIERSQTFLASVTQELQRIAIPEGERKNKDLIPIDLAAEASDLEEELEIRMEQFPGTPLPQELVDNLRLLLEMQQKNKLNYLPAHLLNKFLRLGIYPTQTDAPKFLSATTPQERIKILASGELRESKPDLFVIFNVLSLMDKKFTEAILKEIISGGNKNVEFINYLMFAYRSLTDIASSEDQVKAAITSASPTEELKQHLKVETEVLFSMEHILNICDRLNAIDPNYLPKELKSLIETNVNIKSNDSSVEIPYRDLMRLSVLSPVFNKLLHQQEGPRKTIQKELTLKEISIEDLNVLLEIAKMYGVRGRAIKPFLENIYEKNLLSNILSVYNVSKFLDFEPTFRNYLSNLIFIRIDNLSAPGTPVESLQNFFIEQLIPVLQSDFALNWKPEHYDDILNLFYIYSKNDDRITDFREKFLKFMVGYDLATRAGAEQVKAFLDRYGSTIPENIKALFQQASKKEISTDELKAGVDSLKNVLEHNMDKPGLRPGDLDLQNIEVTPNQLKLLEGMAFTTLFIKSTEEFTPKVKEDLQRTFPNTTIFYAL